VITEPLLFQRKFWVVASAMLASAGFSIQLPLAFLLLLGLAVVEIPLFLVFLPLLASILL
jgi:hypothetical protein